MTDSERLERYGRAWLDPDADVIAGSYGTWRLTYVVGNGGIALMGSIHVSADSDTDWGIPQFEDPAADGYMVVQAPEGVSVSVVTFGFGSLRATVHGRALQAGERIVLTYGDVSGGSRGSRAQTFVQERRAFAVRVDMEGDGNLVPLADQPFVRVVGGPAVGLVLVVPSIVEVGQPFRILARAEGAWNNPSASYRGTVRIESGELDFLETRHTFTEEDRGVWWLEGCRCRAAGLLRVQCVEETGKLRAESNPLLCVSKLEGPALYWGDPHGGQLRNAEKIPQFFEFARDVSGIDFAGYQANAHRISPVEWALQQQAEVDFYEPGRFVPIPGFEWTGETWVGGHHNVYLRRHNQPIRRSKHLSQIADLDDKDSDLPHILDVYRAYRGTDTVITPHVGGGRADLTHHEAELEPAIEVTSTHGTFEWFIEDALGRGYKVGLVGGSDGTTGRPGREYPGYQERRYAKGGLAALYAEELTLPGILGALTARRAYGTTGSRTLVRMSADGHAMGEEYSSPGNPVISAMVAGTAPLESIELYRGLDLIYRHSLSVPQNRRRIRVLWEGASRKTSYSGVIWEGTLRSSDTNLSIHDTVRFDSPRSFAEIVDQGVVHFRSVSCGYRSGFALDVCGDQDTRFDLTANVSLIVFAAYGGFGDTNPKRITYRPTENITCTFTLGELIDGPLTLDIGDVGRRITIGFDTRSETRDVEFSYTDLDPKPGANAYWLRVLQADGEMAWTSPIFLDHYSGV